MIAPPFKRPGSMPTIEQCERNEKRDMPGGRGFSFAAFHPQCGGYHGRCIVETGPRVGNCYDVTNWHDGEFPVGDESQPDVKHYCDPMQLVDFGLLVLEQQMSMSATKEVAAHERASLTRAAERIAALLRESK